MIADPFIKLSLERIDEFLELSLQQLSISSEQYQEEDDRLQVLQEKLQKIKLIAEKVHSSLQSHSLKTVNVDYGTILEVVSDLSDDHLSEEQSALQKLVINAIYQYVVIICYYTLKYECISFLPRAYESSRYFKNISDSKLNSVVYSLQTLPSKISIFLKQLVERFRKISSTYPPGNHIAQKLQVMGQNLFDDVKPKWSKMMMVHDLRFVGLPERSVNWFRFFLNLPRAMIRDELHKKVEFIDNLTSDYTIRLGQLLLSFESKSNEKESYNSHKERLAALERFFNISKKGDLYNVVKKSMEFHANAEDLYIHKPSMITRYWPTALITLVYGPSSIIYIWESRFKILQFLQENVVDFAMGLIYNWIYKPLKSVWATVRHDDDSSIAMMSEGTLDSEINSLTRMIVSFVKEKGNSDIDPEALVKQIEHGDLTEFMEIYESQLEKPIKNIATGGLIRSLLIQVQKTKVDGSLALNGIDKMLQSQQLVFGVVAVSPALLILYVTITSVYQLVSVGRIWSNIEQNKRNLSSCLNNVERLLNHDGNLNEDTAENYLNQGLLVIEAASVAEYGTPLIPRLRINEWYRDIEEISDLTFTNSSRLNVINRIYHVYGKYLT